MQSKLKENKDKVQKIAKYALMSPFLTYTEVVPSKPSKEIL